MAEETVTQKPEQTEAAPEKEKVINTIFSSVMQLFDRCNFKPKLRIKKPKLVK